MPLKPGSDQDTVSQNIREMIASGYGQRQAVAASLHNADKYKPHRAMGGGMMNLGDTMGGLFGNSKFGKAFDASKIGQFFGNGFSGPGGGGGGFSTPFTGNSQPAQPSVPLQQPMTPINHYAPLPAAPTSMTPAGPTNQVMGRAAGGALPWFARNEARSMLHTGPIKSPVAGRTDHIPLKVPSGSYVLPADHISHMGQNNTDAGMVRAAHMFGGQGPFGSTAPKVTRGRGAPHAPPVSRPPPSPSMKGIFASGGKTFEGSAHGDDDGVDIMAAGGEFVIPPDIVEQIGGGNLDHGHQVLDEWVLRTRKEHKAKLHALPPPAK
jgi:hypothetical protein